MYDIEYGKLDTFKEFCANLTFYTWSETIKHDYWNPDLRDNLISCFSMDSLIIHSDNSYERQSLVDQYHFACNIFIDESE